MTQTVQLELAPASTEADARVNSIRLVAQEGRAALVSSSDSADGTRTLSLSPIEGVQVARAQRLFDVDSPFGIPLWDVAATPNGIAAVWTRPGSAISPLVSRHSTTAEAVLTSQYSMGVFQNPRFVRGENGTALTAITEEDNERVLVLFREGRRAYITLPSTGPGRLVEGLLLRQRSSYLLFATILPPGPRGAERADLRGENLPPGVLVCLRLDADLKPVGDRVNPLGDVPVFESDADVSGDRVFLFATTRRGHISAHATADGDALEWMRSPEVQVPFELVAPSVLAQGTTAIAAAIASSAGQRPVIRLGRYQMQP
jgi:hypothetical protein